MSSKPSSNTHAPFAVTADQLATLKDAGYRLPEVWPEGVLAALDMNSQNGWNVRKADGNGYIAPDGTELTRAANGTTPQVIGLSKKGNPCPLRIIGKSRPHWLPNQAASKAGKVTRGQRGPKVVNVAAGKVGGAARANTKIAMLIDLLFRGTTTEEIDATLGGPKGLTNTRQRHLQVYGYGVRQEGGRFYLVLPEGMKEPTPHVMGGEVKPEQPTSPKGGKKAKQPNAGNKSKTSLKLLRPAPKPSAKKGSKKAKLSKKASTSKTNRKVA